MSPRPKIITSLGTLQPAILSIAWKQIAESGAAALSLRAIARELGITAPSIYNYFPNRDALVTALIVDGFTSFGDALEQAINAQPETAHLLRFRAIGMAYHQWAMLHPERYHLLFGTPIAGYTAPIEITQPAASRSLSHLVAVMHEAHEAGLLKINMELPSTPQMEAMMAAWQNSGAPRVNGAVLYLAITTWAHVHGLVSLEIGQQYPPFVTHTDQLYQLEIDRLMQALFTSSGELECQKNM
jgi:AcrR family transcriptional regulator